MNKSMRKLLSKIWFPLIAVALAGLQMWASDSFRLSKLEAEEPAPEQKADTVIYSNKKIYTKFRKEGSKALADSLEGVMTEVEDTTPVILAKDTIKVPDSLKNIDPFRYRWYVSLVDSLAHRLTVDSLRNAGDSIVWKQIDSIYFADSVKAAKIKFQNWYNSLSKDERRRYDDKQKLKRQQRELDSLFAVKDSIQHIKDSIAENTPRILETFALPDSLWYKRIIRWNRDNLFSNIKYNPIDTTSNYWFNDYCFLREDVGAVAEGTYGGAYMPFDFFKRNSSEGVSFYKPYEGYSFSPSTIPMYNTKTPYTELAYWGTLLSNVETEESNIHILASQNIYPALNISLEYDRNGTNGMLTNERVDNRNYAAWFNYTGKKYLAHGGIIGNIVKNHENGGMTDSFWLRDTTLESSREIPVFFENGRNKIKKTILFLDQQYRFPLPFLAKLFGRQADSTATDMDITSAYLGHSSEYSNYSRVYTDEIGLADSLGRAYYNNVFNINPTKSADSVNVKKIENRIFARLQPWSKDAVVSSLDVGLGNRIMKYYMFQPEGYLGKPGNTTWNSTYLYGGVGGTFKGFAWNAQAFLTLVGDESGDSGIKADADYAFYPFRKAKKSPVKIHLSFETTLKRPDFFELHYYGNHDKWDNDFKKITTTKLQGSIDIPHWGLKASAGYSLMDGNIWYDSLGVVHQNTTPMHVAKFALEKDLSLWKLHLDTRALVQVSSNKDVLPLPPVAINSKLYFQFNIKGDVMKMQLGANARWTTAWYIPAYRPSTGVFTNQSVEKVGGKTPYVDLFVNMQWKRACIFVKYINGGLDLFGGKPDYFSARGQMWSHKTIKLGIWIPFYTSHIKNNPMSSRASSVH